MYQAVAPRRYDSPSTRDANAVPYGLPDAVSNAISANANSIPNAIYHTNTYSIRLW